VYKAKWIHFLIWPLVWGVEEQDVLAAPIRKSREASLERTAEDEGQHRSCRHIMDFSDGDDAWVQQGGFMAKPKMKKVMGMGRDTETRRRWEWAGARNGQGHWHIVEDEMPRQKKKKHESCDREWTPSAETYECDSYYGLSSEEEEKKESNSDLSHEDGMFGWSEDGMFWEEKFQTCPMKKAKKPGEPMVDLPQERRVRPA